MELDSLSHMFSVGEGWGEGLRLWYGVPNLFDIALRIHVEDLLAGYGGFVLAGPGVDGVVAGDGGGDDVGVGVGLAVIVHGGGGLLAGVGLAVAGQVGAHEAAIDLLVHAAPGGALAEDLLRHVRRGAAGLHQAFDDRLGCLGTGVAPVRQVDRPDRGAVIEGIAVGGLIVGGCVGGWVAGTVAAGAAGELAAGATAPAGEQAANSASPNNTVKIFLGVRRVFITPIIILEAVPDWAKKSRGGEWGRSVGAGLRPAPTARSGSQVTE